MSSRIKKKKVSGLRRTGRTLYHTLLALSVLIVVAYCTFQVLVPTPSQAAPPMIPTFPVGPIPTDNPDTDEDESLPAATPLVRREGVYTFLLAATDVSGGNTDSIMVVSYDTVNQKVGVVSIPRDTLVKRKFPKINSVYSSGGPEELMQVVGNLMGIPIDHYITVNIKAFQALVNAVDGIDFYVPCNMNYDDSTPGEELHIHYTEGMHHLNGKQALEVVRFRHNNDKSGYNDTGRAQTQQQLLMAVVKKVLSPSNLKNLNTFLTIFSENVKTDLSGADMAYFVSKSPGVDIKSAVSTATLPGRGDVTYHNVQWCYQLNREECLAIFNELLNPYTTPITMEMTNMFQAK